MKKQLIIVIIAVALLNIVGPLAYDAINVESQTTHTQKILLADYDPLVDINVTVTILSVRALEIIENDSAADFTINLTVNDKTYQSPIWPNADSVYPMWTTTTDIPDNQQFCNITIKLFESDTDSLEICDIGPSAGNNLEDNQITCVYDVKTGHWAGDDHLGDSSGYGRASGCDDGSIYQNERDCEIEFVISQNDYDDDGIPFWIETYEYYTNPLVDNRGQDRDQDSIPIEWEHKWGYNPFKWDDHTNIDDDKDSLSNYEEYLTTSYGSDPFRKDLFLELDYMNEDDDNTSSIVSDAALELLKNPFHRRNIMFHIETDEKIPFDESTNQDELLEIYSQYFDHTGNDKWRRGVFHYGVFVHKCVPVGYSFAGDGPTFWGYIPGTNAFIVSSTQMERFNTFRPGIPLKYFHASVIMHELGHNFGIRFGEPPGCDNQFSKYPWQLGYYIYRSYESIMNYRYTYKILDYSDGSHGTRDFDDWSNINLTYFELPENI